MIPAPLAPEFAWRGGQLHTEGLALAAIAQAVGTPVYVYSAAAMRRTYSTFAEALAGLDAEIFYAVKANANPAVIRLFASLGAGADVVSEGEIRMALAAGVAPARIVFSGVGKTEAELATALKLGVTHINVESEPELAMLSAAAVATGVAARVALRVNPDVDARTHEKISTGRRENKFGIAADRAGAAYARAEALPGIEPDGLAVHIGSQLTSLEPFRAAFAVLARLVAELRSEGHTVSRLDLGGGLGVRYQTEDIPAPADYAAVVRDTVGGLGCTLAFEPGRALVANAGVLVTRVVLVKDGDSRRFAVVDAAMNDLLRPTLYGAHHAIVTVAESKADATLMPYDVVGPVCETGDTFAIARPLPAVHAGDLLAICSVGAYGAVMASSYNSRPLVPEVLVDGGRFAVIRPRQTYDSMLSQYHLPEWAPALPEDRPHTPPGAVRRAKQGAG